MRDQIRGMETPPAQPLDQFFHQPGGGDPGAVDRLLVMNNVRRRVEFDAATLAEEYDASPLARRADGGGASGIVRGAIHRAFDAISAGEIENFAHVVRTGRQHHVAEAESACKFAALRNYVAADDAV